MNVSRLTVVSAAMLLLVATAARPQSGAKTLDLTLRPELAGADEGASSVSSSGGAVSNVVQSLPLRLRLVELDRRSYRRSEPVVFSVLIENVGKSPVTIPWSWPTSDLRKKPLRQVSRAALGLYLRDEKGNIHSAAGVELMGAANVSETLITLKPGEQVRIKAASSWVMTDATAMWLASVTPSPVQVLAGVSITERAEVTYRRVLSSDYVQAAIAPQ